MGPSTVSACRTRAAATITPARVVLCVLLFNTPHTSSYACRSLVFRLYIVYRIIPIRGRSTRYGYANCDACSRPRAETDEGPHICFKWPLQAPKGIVGGMGGMIRHAPPTFWASIGPTAEKFCVPSSVRRHPRRTTAAGRPPQQTSCEQGVVCVLSFTEGSAITIPHCQSN